MRNPITQTSRGAAGPLLELRPGNATALPDRFEGFRVLQGTLWVSREGSSEDIILRRGACYRRPADGTVVLEGLTDSSVRLCDAGGASESSSAIGGWRRVLAHLRRLLR